MGMPEINIVFREAATAAIDKSRRGVVAVILRDNAELTAQHFAVETVADVPAGLTADNKGYLERALMGYINRPAKLLVYVEETEAASFTASLAWLGGQIWDYVCGPFDCKANEAKEIADWVIAQRANNDAIYKAVLPNYVANSEAVVNFATSAMTAGGTVFTTAGYCSRIAGILAGTPLNYSATYALLTEVADCVRMTRNEMDEAVDAGKLILYANNKSVRLGRAVNSMTTTSEGKGPAYKKIKIVAALDTIISELRDLIEENYIGKYANSYDNKMVLLTAINDYMDTMVAAEVVADYHIEIDMVKQREYLRQHGVDTSTMTDEEIRHAMTGSYVFLTGTAKLYDAIEDVDLTMTFGV